MSTAEIAEINRVQLGRWAEILTQNHATPVVLVGIGRDLVSGTHHVCLPKGLPKEYAVNALRTVLLILETEVE